MEKIEGLSTTTSYSGRNSFGISVPSFSPLLSPTIPYGPNDNGTVTLKMRGD